MSPALARALLSPPFMKQLIDFFFRPSLFPLLSLAGFFYLYSHSFFLLPEHETDPDDYEEVLGGWSPDRVKHFPQRIPEEASDARMMFFPGFLQGGAYLQLRLTLPPGDVDFL